MPETKETSAQLDPELLGLPAGDTLTLKMTRTIGSSEPDPQPEPDPDPQPDPQPEPGTDLSSVWGAGILSLPEYPAEAVDLRDVAAIVRNGKAYRTRLEEYVGGGTPDNPGTGPVVTKTLGTRGTVNIFDEGARGTSRDADRRAFLSALAKVRDGGKVFVPYGKWLVSDVAVPGAKDILIEGETELGAELVGSAGRDILIWKDDNTQRRLQNRQIVRGLRFYMPGNGSKGNFNRKTFRGWQPGAACLAWIQKAPTSDGNRKMAWGNSYVTIQNCTARGDKSAIGATFLYSDRALYGLRVQNLFIGDHGTTVSGLHGGIIMGVPPFTVAEYAPDEVGIDHFVHWGGQCSIAISNIANGHIRDHKAYACKWPIHLTGQPNNGPRDRGREFELNALYYDNDVVNTLTGDREMIHLDLDNCTFGTIHLKGSRNGQARPKVLIEGKNFRGGVIATYSSSIHKAPEFVISGTGHQFAISPAGTSGAEKASLINGRSSYPGVSILG